MAHKRFSSPTSGSNPEILYGVDWNKLIAGLEGENTSDPFTFNIDYHVIKHTTTNNPGDLYVSDGTRIVRFGKGTADQIIHVKSDGTDIEWADPSVAGGASELADLTDVVVTSVVDNQVLTWNSTTSKWVNQVASGGGGGTGGFPAGGIIQFSGNSTTTVFNIPHGLADPPDIYFVNAVSTDAIGAYTYVADATNIIVTYTVAPPTATNNVDFMWGAGYTDVAASTFTPTTTDTLTNKTIDSDSNIITNIVDADIKSSAAIAYSKLNLATSIINADIAAGAAIAKTKLASLDIVNADINAAAAIAYSKLSLTGAILNADLAGSIAYSKLALTGAITNADLAGSITFNKLLNRYEGLSTDARPVSPATGSQYYSTDTGDTEIYDGTYWWLVSMGPFSNFKPGYWNSNSSVLAGYGMLNALTAPATVGAQAYVHDTNGRYGRLRSGATSGNRGGCRVSNVGFGLPDNNLRMRLKVAPQSLTAAKYYFGFTNQTAEIGGDDPLNALQGFFVGYSSTLNPTNFICLHNNGTGATVVDDTGVVASTAVRGIRIVSDPANSRWSYSLDSGVTYAHVSTELPLTGTANYCSPHIIVETSEAVLKDCFLYSWYTQSDK